MFCGRDSQPISAPCHSPTASSQQPWAMRTFFVHIHLQCSNIQVMSCLRNTHPMFCGLDGQLLRATCHPQLPNLSNPWPSFATCCGNISTTPQGNLLRANWPMPRRLWTLRTGTRSRPPLPCIDCSFSATTGAPWPSVEALPSHCYAAAYYLRPTCKIPAPLDLSSRARFDCRA